MTYAKKTDKNQKLLVEYLRAIGCSVQPLHDVGRGVPDLLVGYRGTNYLFEVKDKRGTLTDVQIEWHENWLGTVYIIRSTDDINKILGVSYGE